MAHSGVFLERQYLPLSPASRTDRSRTTSSDRLVQRGFARVEATSHLYQGRFYHLHHKRLYRSDRPDRQPQPEAGASQPDDRAADAARHRPRRPRRAVARHGIGQGAVLPGAPRAIPHDAPRAATSDVRIGPNQILRPFADKLPIGVDPLRDQYVFTYLVTRSSPLEFRSFLIRHFSLMRLLLRWTLRVFVPKKFEKAIPALKHAVNEEFRRPLRPRDGEELLWFFRQRQEAAQQPAFVPETRYLEAAKQFSAPRFGVLERVWRLHGNDVIWNV